MNISAAQTRYLLPKTWPERCSAWTILKSIPCLRLSPVRPSAAVDCGAPSAWKLPTLEDAGHSLTKGKLNAVRAAFKAGVKPSRDCAEVWDFTIRCHKGARHRTGPKIAALVNTINPRISEVI